MVVFGGSWVLPTVLGMKVTMGYNLMHRQVPRRNSDYQVFQSDQGRAVAINGEIRVTGLAEVLRQVEFFRRYNDGVSRMIDLQDTSTPPFLAKLVHPTYILQFGDWFADETSVPYTVTFVEAAV